jgi:hypothetical protein
MELAQDDVQWDVLLLAVFEISDTFHSTFPVNNNSRNENISVSLLNCIQEGAVSQTSILDCTYGEDMFLRCTFLP